MATGHFFKHSSNVGAPPMRNIAGDLIAVLDWALDVAGGVYWQKVFSGANKAVYRATTGQRRYLRVRDDGTTFAWTRGYNSMSNVDTGAELFPSITHVADSATFGLYKSSSATPSTYRIVGDSRYFVLICNAAGDTDGSGVWGIAFGEGTPHDPLDAGFTMMRAGSTGVGGTNDGEILSRSSEMSTINRQVYLSNDRDGVLPSRVGNHSNGIFTGASASMPPVSAVPFLVKKQVAVIDMGGSTSLTEAYERGLFPYCYAIAVQYDGASFPYDQPLVLGGSTYRPYRGWSSGPVFLLRTSNDEPGRV